MACLDLVTRFYDQSSKLSNGKGYFLNEIDPRHFMIVVEEDRVNAVITDTCRLVDYACFMAQKRIRLKF